ncbi:hypothetical protein GCM10010182_71550 [Actinomadura cremea]|nr:hypothetical protein GCM10010182_71550 [Actinomadura cremea]
MEELVPEPWTRTNVGAERAAVGPLDVDGMKVVRSDRGMASMPEVESGRAADEEEPPVRGRQAVDGAVRDRRAETRRCGRKSGETGKAERCPRACFGRRSPRDRQDVPSQMVWSRMK